MSATKYKFRHYRPYEDGVSRLIWASNGPDRSESISHGIAKGSVADLDVMQSQLWTYNELTNEGEIDILDTYFNDQAVRATLYFRLWGASLAADTVTDATAGEITGTGYTGLAVARGTDWNAPAAGPTGTTQPTAKTFTGGAGGWSAATWLALCTGQSGTGGLMIATAVLSTSRTLLENDTLDVTIQVALD